MYADQYNMHDIFATITHLYGDINTTTYPQMELNKYLTLSHNDT